jgi:hypothetical protein
MKESRVDARHIDVTRDDGSVANRYEVGAMGGRTLESIQENDQKNGTSMAYEPASCLEAFMKGDARGAKKVRSNE